MRPASPLYTVVRTGGAKHRFLGHGWGGPKPQGSGNLGGPGQGERVIPPPNHGTDKESCRWHGVGPCPVPREYELNPVEHLLEGGHFTSKERGEFRADGSDVPARFHQEGGNSARGHEDQPLAGQVAAAWHFIFHPLAGH